VPVADEYLHRIAERHKLVEPPPGRDRKGYEALAHLTRQAFSGEAAAGHAQFFNEFHALTVAVGKTHCGKTAQCAGCPLEADLRYVSK
jgi:endonuclease-3 related protein